jgi:tripartite-type tricarboxylate transporter receptor subunit TctC
VPSTPSAVLGAWRQFVAPAAASQTLLRSERADPNDVQRPDNLGAEAIGSTREELAARIAAEDARWGELVRAAGITAE